MGSQDFDLKEIDQAFRSLRRRAQDLRPVWRKVRPAFRKDQRDHMKAQQGPDGPWQSLAPSTRAGRISKGGRSGKFTKRGLLKKRVQKTLSRILSRKLITGAKIKVEPEQMSITANGKVNPGMSGAHQEGAIVGRGSKLPARPFLWVSDSLGESIAAEMEASLIAAFKGRTI